MDPINFDGRLTTNVPLVVEARGGRRCALLGAATPPGRGAAVEALGLDRSRERTHASYPAG
jgi:hypothetical protein